MSLMQESHSYHTARWPSRQATCWPSRAVPAPTRSYGTAGTYDLDAVLPNAWWQLTAGGNGHTVTFTATDTLFEDLDFGLAALVDTTLVEGSLVHGLAPLRRVIDLIASATNAGTSTPQGVLASPSTRHTPT